MSLSARKSKIKTAGAMTTWVALPLIILIMIFPQTVLYPYEIPETGEIDPFIAEMESKLTRLQRTYALPGIGVAIIRNNNTQFITSGRTNFWRKQPISADSSFQIASMSKSQCALAIMDLFQKGNISLDDPILNYISEWSLPVSPYNENVTIRRILCHAAGLNVGAVNVGAFKPENVPPIEDALEKEGVEVVVIPGSTYLYSGGGFGILQLLIEELSNVSYQNYMDEVVFQPMGMNRTKTTLVSQLKDNLAVPHTKFRLPIPIYYNSIEAAAGHYSSLADMALWCQKLMNNQTILTPMVQNLMLTPQWGSEWGYTLGFRYEVMPNGKVIFGHGGDNTGAHGTYQFCPETGDAIVILTNGEWGAVPVSQIYNCWQKIIGGIEEPTGWEVQWRQEKQKFLIQNVVISLISGILVVVLLLLILRNWIGIGRIRRKNNWQRAHIHGKINESKDGSELRIIHIGLRIILFSIFLLLAIYLLLRWDFFHYEYSWDPPNQLISILILESWVIMLSISALKVKIIKEKKSLEK